ncbi:MBL fold metallo-hydrolase [Actinorugispora endophytica]|uniref:L-ascorbate metabolism protein UlaG (Beta-lactamase superfamily) n=1 Tax=Actinorugispora endophytica TaxID=1605990 RepID=A0A4R6V4J4_9ACTN|nr:MBL fold metallo-hydrolase [Actinorugispora endophytica]TDQ53782.1 L-ascorbate metabolism protein UlaG (beta-lactamase superfamily) [Actinorugispora endophytica]
MSENGFNRRGFLRAAGAGTALASVLGAGASAAHAAPAPAPAGTAGSGSGGRAVCDWLGTSGWRVRIGSAQLLVDPYITRFPTGLFQEGEEFDSKTSLTVDAATVDRIAGDPGVVLVTHSHWDHFGDVPHIATTTGARVVGTATTCNLALAMDVPTSKVSPVKGGEVLDFGDYTVEVVGSLHSRNPNYSMAFPGVRLERPATRPATIADLPEGDTLAFQVTVGNGPSLFFMGASDFVERNLEGLAPDVAMLAAPSTTRTHEYVPRLMEALDKPRKVVLVHWDNFEVPLENPPKPDTTMAFTPQELADAVRAVSPQTEVVIPEYLTSYTFR